jgi:hypothetical protein
MKAKSKDGQIKITFNREDWAFPLLALAKMVESDKHREILEHWRTNLDERSWDLIDDAFNLTELPVYLDRNDALTFSDDLVDALFPPIKDKTNHLKIARVCTYCQQAYVAEAKCVGHDDCKAGKK